MEQWRLLADQAPPSIDSYDLKGAGFGLGFLRDQGNKLVLATFNELGDFAQQTKLGGAKDLDDYTISATANKFNMHVAIESAYFYQGGFNFGGYISRISTGLRGPLNSEEIQSWYSYQGNPARPTVAAGSSSTYELSFFDFMSDGSQSFYEYLAPESLILRSSDGTQVDQSTTSLYATDVAVSGDRALVCDGVGGDFEVWSIASGALSLQGGSSVPVSGGFDDKVKLAALGNGGFALAWIDPHGAGAADNTLDVSFLNSADIVLTSGQTIAGATEFDIVGLPDGGWAVAWRMANGIIELTEYDANGFISENANVAPNGTMPEIGSLGDGRVAVSWMDSGSLRSQIWDSRSSLPQTGSDAADHVVLGVGDDSFSTRGGDDTVFGWSGNDTLFGQVGRDDLSGNDGNDRLIGGRNPDTLFGNDGADQLSGGNGNDSLDGGNGDDTLIGGLRADNLIGGRGQDVLNGGRGEDSLFGNGGPDVLNGGFGNDALNGGRGADSLNGGGGDDQLVGGEGGNAFIFAGAFGHDTVTDFSAANFENVNLSGVDAITSFHDLMKHHLFDDPGGSGFALIDDGTGNTILLNGVAVNEIGGGKAYSAHDFIF